MMQTEVDLSAVLSMVKDKDSYVFLNQENICWHSSSKVNMNVCFSGKKAVIPFNSDLSYLASSFHHVFGKEQIFLCWGAKDLFSFIKGKTGILPECPATIYDLSLICSYLSFDDEKPTSFNSAVSLMKRFMKETSWQKFSKFYFEVYLPLFSKILPEIETNCLVDNKARKCVYPFYVLEGQANGRLKTMVCGDSSYNPHSLGPTQKQNLRPADYDEIFVYFDYRNMEVAVLQWLSGDKTLGGILESEEDIYKQIWSKITCSVASDSHRKICKDTFLPVIFGQGKNSLSENLGISEKNTSKLIHNLVSSFPVAFDWVSSQSPDSNNMATDVFGRRRYFADHELYKIRNFCIQSPSSMVCLRKLVRLHEILIDKARIGFHIHDGYCVICKKNQLNSIYEIATSILEEEDPLFPGLKLRTSCTYGINLNDMKEKTIKKEMV